MAADGRPHPLPSYPEDTNAVVLLDEQATTVNESGEIETFFRQAYKILRPGGRSRGIVAVYFDSETQLTSLKGWSITAAGRDYEVKEKDAVETSLFSAALYQDARAKVLRLPAAEPGNVVGYEYVQRRRPEIFQDTWWFQDEIPVRRARFVLRLPAVWEFRSVWLNHAPRRTQVTAQNQLVWEMADLPAVESEPSMPPGGPLRRAWPLLTFPARRRRAERAMPPGRTSVAVTES